MTHFDYGANNLFVIRVLQNILDELQQDRAQIESKIRWVKSKIQSVEAKIASQGGEFFNKYNELIEEKAKLDLTRIQVKDSIRDMCHDLFPFSICKELSTKLIQRLNQETNIIKSKNAKDSIKRHISFLKQQLKKELTDKNVQPINETTINFIIKKITFLFRLIYSMNF